MPANNRVPRSQRPGRRKRHQTIEEAAADLAQRLSCLLCGDPDWASSGVFTPGDQRAIAQPGCTRSMVFVLCERCHRLPGVLAKVHAAAWENFETLLAAEKAELESN
jgi:hypothetical protein